MTNAWEGKKPQDWINVVLAGCLFLAPWVLGFAEERYAAWNAWISAVVIAAVAVAALLAFTEWEEWVRLVLGVWVIVAPWILGFVSNQPAMWAHVVLGLLIVLATAWQLWEIRQRTRATA